MTSETIFTYGAPSLKFGEGSADEIGADLRALGATRALIVTDAGIVATGAPERIATSLRSAGVEPGIFDAVQIERLVPRRGHLAIEIPPEHVEIL